MGYGDEETRRERTPLRTAAVRWISSASAAFLLSCSALAASPTIAVVSGDNVNVRVAPSPTGQIVETVKAGTPVIVTSVEKEWAQVSFRGPDGKLLSGWIHAGLLRVVRGGGGGGGDTYSNGYGAEFHLSVDSMDLDCSEGFDGGFDRCEVDVSVSADSNYNGSDEPTINYTCEIELSIETADGWPTRESESESSSIYGRNGSDSLSISFSLFSYEPITRARIKDSSCQIDSVDE